MMQWNECEYTSTTTSTEACPIQFYLAKAPARGFWFYINRSHLAGRRACLPVGRGRRGTGNEFSPRVGDSSEPRVLKELATR